jgi:hypothetical protein
MKSASRALRAKKNPPPGLPRELLRAAVREDLGAGDLTSRAVIPAGLMVRGLYIVKAHGVVAGLALLPEVFALRQNRPNPFRARTGVRFALPAAEDVTLAVYDVAGDSWEQLRANAARIRSQERDGSPSPLVSRLRESRISNPESHAPPRSRIGIALAARFFHPAPRHKGGRHS